jgi:hypothetical protein
MFHGVVAASIPLSVIEIVMKKMSLLTVARPGFSGGKRFSLLGLDPSRGALR